jgi:hypothetical protein
MAEPCLDCPGVVALIGVGVATGVTEHVRMRLELEAGAGGSTLTRATNAVKDIFRRIDWLKVAKHAGGPALTTFTGIPTPDQLQAIATGLQNMLADPAKLATKENITAAIDGVKSILRPESEGKNVPEEISEFRKAFDKLLVDAGVKQLAGETGAGAQGPGGPGVRRPRQASI